MMKSCLASWCIISVGLVSLLLPVSVNATAQFAFSSQESFSISTIAPTDSNIIEFHGSSAYKITQQALSALLPPEVNLTALDFINKNTVVFSLREDAVLPSIGLVANEDLLEYNGSSISLIFDGSTFGLPPEVGIDGVDVITLSPLTCSISLREDATLPGVGYVSRNDAVRFQSGAFTGKDFNSVTAGLPAETNLDGFSRPGDGTFVISLNASANLGGTVYGKSDLVRYSGGTFSSFFNAASNGIPLEVNLQDAETNAVAIPVELSRFYSE